VESGQVWEKRKKKSERKKKTEISGDDTNVKTTVKQEITGTKSQKILWGKFNENEKATQWAGGAMAFGSNTGAQKEKKNKSGTGSIALAQNVECSRGLLVVGQSTKKGAKKKDGERERENTQKGNTPFFVGPIKKNEDTSGWWKKKGGRRQSTCCSNSKGLNSWLFGVGGDENNVLSV